MWREPTEKPAITQVATQQERFADAWAPVFTTIHGYYVARGGGFDGQVFSEKQTPIRPTRALRGQVSLEQPRVEEFDYLLIQQLKSSDAPVPAPLDGELVVAAGPWRLYQRRPQVAPAQLSSESR